MLALSPVPSLAYRSFDDLPPAESGRVSQFWLRQKRIIKNDSLIQDKHKAIEETAILIYQLALNGAFRRVGHEPLIDLFPYYFPKNQNSVSG
jgi:hypothetical protein